MKKMTYIKMGLIERRKKTIYFLDGYSLNGNTYPWISKREAHHEAREAGCKADFKE